MAGVKTRDVGVVGLGIIGSRVSASLRRANFNVFVWNRSPRPVPAFVSSPREIAELCTVIQIFVRDAGALMDVMADMKPALEKRHVVCCHSTVGARAVREAADIAAEMGAGFLDAPFTGSKLAAEKGDLVYYVSGPPGDFERAAAVLQASSKKILDFGPRIGDATVLKIATNLVSGAVVVALAEALAMARAHDVEPARLLEAFEGNANCSPLITMKLSSMMASSYEPHFSLKNMLKDARYAQLLAKGGKVPARVLDAAAEAMDAAARAGKGEMDYSVVFESIGKPGAAASAEGEPVEPVVRAEPGDSPPVPATALSEPLAPDPVAPPSAPAQTLIRPQAAPPGKPAATPIKIRIAKENKWHTLKASVFESADWDKETA